MTAAKVFKIIGVVIISLLEALGWLMALGGTGKLHNDCRDYQNDESCSDQFRAVWWSVFFQFFVLLGVAIFVAANALEKFRIPLVAFLVLTTVRTMEEAENGLTLKDANQSFLSDSAMDSATGGFVLMSMMNFLLIALVGSTGVPNVNITELNNRLKAVMARPQQTQAAAPVAAPGPMPPAPMPAAPPQAVGYPKHDGFNPHPQPPFDYTQQQQQHQQHQQHQQQYPPPPHGGAPNV